MKQKWNNLKGESSDVPTVDTKTVEVTQETNDYDCGLFVMYFMKLFLKQAPKRFKIQNLKMVLSLSIFGALCTHDILYKLMYMRFLNFGVLAQILFAYSQGHPNFWVSYTK